MEAQQLADAVKIDLAHAEALLPGLEAAIKTADLDTPARLSAFLAQTGHESGGFKFLEENLNYKPETLCRVWPSHFNEENCYEFSGNPEAIANFAYAGRMGNGDEASGDGWNYCGRGLIQITGKANYGAFAQSIDTPVDQIPEFLGTFEGAVQSACWFWESNNLNALADKGDVLGITKKVNGGTLGLEERQQHTAQAHQVLQG